jgi:hypothetical protein
MIWADGSQVGATAGRRSLLVAEVWKVGGAGLVPVWLSGWLITASWGLPSGR